MINLFKKATILFLFLYLPFCGMAWGVLGHRIVGQIADTYLTKKTKREIFKILGNESVAMTSNWPDFIKSDPAYKYLDTWHYINFKSGLSETDLKNYLATDTLTDAYTKVNWLTGQLKNKELEQDKKIFYLRRKIREAPHRLQLQRVVKAVSGQSCSGTWDRLVHEWNMTLALQDLLADTAENPRCEIY